jgi:hypothetical protein
VPFIGTQTAGNLNVVIVGWNDSTAQVQSVTDTKGNAYALAVGPTVQMGVATQSTYYAKNIAAATPSGNTVTVTFTVSAVFPDIRIAEYSGIDPSVPVDVVAAAQGSGASSDSGSVTTGNANDLLVGANLVQTGTKGPGPGYTSRVITNPDGDILEDSIVTAIGSYSATAPLTAAGPWIMQMVAFRTPVPGGDTQPPTAPSGLTTTVNGSQINLSWTASTDNVGVTGYLVERCQGAGCATFAQIATPTTTTYNDSGLATSTSYSYRVRATDAAGNLSLYSNVASVTTGAGLSLSPRVTVLTFTQTQQFTALGTGLTWFVDGVAGGSPSSGTVSNTGLYTPPPTAGSHTVMVTDGTLSNSATVYVSNHAGVFTYHNDNSRTGENANETVLTPANVNSAQFGKLFSYSLDGQAYASPLYVANVNIPGQGIHNVVYVATEHDSVYAFDADGLLTNPLWKTSFLGPGVTPGLAIDTGACCDITPEIGITGTPVIDPAAGTLYVVAKTKQGFNYDQRLHALDIATGAEKFGGPVVIQASVTGTGAGAQGGQVAFDALKENQRAALLLSNGVVYVAWAAHGDGPPWHGWVIGFNAATLQSVMTFNVSPNGYGGGIWQSGGGLATDSTGNVFFATGNGNFNANTGGTDYGDSVLKLSPTGTVVDYFTPNDQNNLEASDWDLASAGPVLVLDQPGPNPHLLMTAGKGGNIYVINRDNMGHYNSANDNQIVQSLVNIFIKGVGEPGNFIAPVYFNGYVYFSPVTDKIQAFQITNGLLSAAPTSQTSLVYAYPGGPLSISANGTANGILWAVQRQSSDPQPGTLHAYDPANLSVELYNSDQAGSRDTLDIAVKFTVPLVVNGKVFVASNSKLTVYGLLP